MHLQLTYDDSAGTRPWEHFLATMCSAYARHETKRSTPEGCIPCKGAGAHSYYLWASSCEAAAAGANVTPCSDTMTRCRVRAFDPVFSQSCEQIWPEHHYLHFVNDNARAQTNLCRIVKSCWCVGGGPGSHQHQSKPRLRFAWTNRLTRNA